MSLWNDIKANGDSEPGAERLTRNLRRKLGI
jgi:hypothetical protein